jgi:benzodiazapine receptor
MPDMTRAGTVLDRPGRLGLLTSVASFVTTTLIVNAIIFSFRVDRSAGAALDRISWAPPGWAVGAIWVVLFALYAVSFWLLRQRGDDGRRASIWVLAIAAWDLAYPLLTNGFDLVLSAWLNLATVVFTALLLWRVWTASRLAFVALLPSLAWICFATVLTFVVLMGPT